MLSFDRCKMSVMRMNENEIPTCSRGTRTEYKSNLIDMDEFIRYKISDYLRLSDWQSLRYLDKSCPSWPKPPPNFDYSIILFYISNCFDKGIMGLAKKVEDMEQAASTVYEELQKDWYNDVRLQYWFIDFDYGVFDLNAKKGNKRSNTKNKFPIVEFPQSQYYEYWQVAPQDYEQFPGVKFVRHPGELPLNYWPNYAYLYHGDRGLEVDETLGSLKAWIGDSNFGPKVDLNLNQFEICEKYDSNGQLMDSNFVDICFNPRSLNLVADKTSSIDAIANGESSWVLFLEHEIYLFDTGP